MRRPLKHLAFLCAACLLLAASQAYPALAGSVGLGANAGGASGGHGQGGGRGWAFGRFRDVGDDHWAFHDVTMMEAKGILRGYGDGRFGPQDPVTRTQLACLAVRIMGCQDEAEALGSEAAGDILSAAWSDAGAVPDWTGARECLAYAYRNGLLDAMTHEGGTAFRPNDPATRLEVVVTLLTAMGLADEAAALAGDPIDAPDADTVPDWARGYIALALRTRLLQGDDTGCLRLRNTVRRCEMAAFLCRADDGSDTHVDDAVLKGDVVSVATGSSPSITVSLNPSELRKIGEEAPPPGGTSPGDGDGPPAVTRTFPVNPEALIFLRGREVGLGELVAGDRVQLRLEDGEVVLVDAMAKQVAVAGTVAAVSSTGTTLASITVVVAEVEEEEEEDPGIEPGARVTFAVSPSFEVWLRGDHDSDARPAVGDHVDLKIVHGVVYVIILNPEAGD